jgi:hypothetical protein
MLSHKALFFRVNKFPKRYFVYMLAPYDVLHTQFSLYNSWKKLSKKNNQMQIATVPRC